jgi:hypothetical protein
VPRGTLPLTPSHLYTAARRLLAQEDQAQDGRKGRAGCSRKQGSPKELPPGGQQRPNLPLAGIVVLDFGEVFQGPYATLLMAKAGADVIKIEPPHGEPLRRRAMITIDRNAQSAVISLRAENPASTPRADLCRNTTVGRKARRLVLFPPVNDSVGVSFRDR